MKDDQLSKTAAFVAVKFYGMTQMPAFGSLFDETVISFYNRLVQTLPAPIRYYHFWLRFGWVRKLYIWSEELMLPGDLLHVVARKWYLQRMAKQLVDEGYEQIIVLGAGFDHLAFYFTQQGLSCFEFDTPYMSNLKRCFLSDCYPEKSHPKIITSHLPTDQLGARFSEVPDINPHKKTILVGEGFFDYLTQQTVSASLNQIGSYFSHNPALLCTHFALNELHPFHCWVFKNSVNLVGEKLKLDASIDQFKQLVNNQGFQIQQLIDSHQIRDELNKTIKTKIGILKGFYILMAKLKT